ncbi:WecB/TagA/CpsF family glycosyltransferase [Lichenifustis flavocetrariae]|uniref:WecB/TagA/CpsF family glycosyltransferase n=1 Tax=Lichenifustis flavocetrariae TaxID=2949735 RepID=A0AA41Z167_9HYPH|nr:WecB/TagA/CpsF family glycosyltransferase [Lichenifustis flavocetrariae]MCW6508618.1 WecB/TagA/CpsF family glycosyltransferase [Lichenifustis flavocetrariae]
MSVRCVEAPLAVVDNQIINVASMQNLVARLVELCRQDEGFTLFTLNLDHLVKRHRDLDFKAAYARATLVSADGWPVAAAARRQGAQVDRVTGADLVIPVCAAAERENIPIYLFGSSSDSLAAAAAALMKRFPGLDIRGMEAPPMGFVPTSSEAFEMAERISQSGARLCFLALGAPKQEIFADAMAARFPGIGFLCIGAALDFVSGRQKRAPHFVQATNFEWFWRLLSEPRRLGRRYAECALFLGQMMMRPTPPVADPNPTGSAGAWSRDVKAEVAAPFRLCVMHPMDPRGSKLGGIETHVRQILARHPDDFSILFVGVDEFGDSPLGVVKSVRIAHRQIDFLPVARIDAAAINLPGKSIGQSTTFRFACGILRHLRAIRRASGVRGASVDLQRFEFATPARLIGLPAVQMVHGEGDKSQAMDSLIKRFWFIHRANEWLALHLARRILCVNPNIVRRLERLYPDVARRAEVMTVSVDTSVFAPKPFPIWDGTFRVMFAGRLDSFKDPPLMFRVLAGLQARLEGKVEFHYVGTTDPSRYAEFAAIESFTVRHGYQPAAEVARIMAGCHAGILTSFFEGMPCYLLEMLSIGRPFAAIRLPQYDPLIVPGLSGHLIERTDPDASCLDDLVAAFVTLRDALAAGSLDPMKIHGLVKPYSIEVQMQRMFALHRALQSKPSITGRPSIGQAEPQNS